MSLLVILDIAFIMLAWKPGHRSKLLLAILSSAPSVEHQLSSKKELRELLRSRRKRSLSTLEMLLEKLHRSLVMMASKVLS